MHLNMMNETQTTKTKLSFVYGKNMCLLLIGKVKISHCKVVYLDD